MKQLIQEIVDFIKSIHEKTDFIPLHAPVFVGNEKRYLNECIDSTFVSYVGEFVKKFEKAISEFIGIKNAVAIVNGTEALKIALLQAGVKQNDEVITTPLSFVATANAITYTGASIVFVDCEKETLGISPEKLYYFLKNNTYISSDGFCYNKLTKRRIYACVPVHVFGHPAKIDEIVEICSNHNIVVIEDAAESLGSYYKNKHTGIFGKAAILSFNGNKIVTTGGGGMVITEDDNFANKVRHLTTTAKVPHPYEFFHDELGYNLRMPNVNAAIGLAQMEKIESFLQSKRKLHEEYKNFFNKIGIEIFTEKEYCRSNYWLNCIFFENRQQRDDFLKFSNENGVMTRPSWVLLNKLPMYKKCQTDDLSNAQWIEDRLVNIPSGVRVADLNSN